MVSALAWDSVLMQSMSNTTTHAEENNVFHYLTDDACSQEKSPASLGDIVLFRRVINT